MEENGFHLPENKFSLFKICSFLENWLPLVSLTVSTKRNTSEKKKPLEGNPLSLAGMKDFVEKYFSSRQKKRSLAGISEKWRKNGFH